MEFVLISAGTFMMGSPASDTEASDDEKPAHRVTISQPFYLGKYPVT
jgi:formylglycine-generating enzyme required for sulfatase activity